MKDLESLDAAFVIDTFLLLLIGIGPKIALVPFLEATASMPEPTKRRVLRKMLTTAATVAALLLILGGVLTRLLHVSPGALGSASGSILRILASTVVKVDDQSAWTHAVLVLGAIVTLYITSGALLKALYVVHWLVWRVHRVMPAGLVPKLAVIGLTLVATALGVALNDLRKSLGIGGAVLALLMITALSFAAWWWVSWKLPHAPAPARALIPGALLMAVGAVVLQLLTTYRVGHLVARNTNTNGAVGIALAVLLWVYILGRIMVGSAGLNAALWYRQQDH